MRRSVRRLVSWSFGAAIRLDGGAALAALVSLSACGSAKSTARHAPAPSASSAQAPASRPLPSGLPPMASMPPPGVAGSKKARTQPDAATYPCIAGPKSPGDVSEQVKRLGEGCAASTKTHALGAPMSGSLGDRDPHAEHRFRAEAGACYRVYLATEPSVKDAIVVMRDSAGDMVAESPGPALPEDGVICFSTSDEVTVLVAVGSGKGKYALQFWTSR